MTDMCGQISEVKSSTRERIGGSADFVFAFACVEWPTEAVEFVTRQRMSSPPWPSESLVKDVVNGGCHLVKVVLRIIKRC